MIFEKLMQKDFHEAFEEIKATYEESFAYPRGLTQEKSEYSHVEDMCEVKWGTLEEQLEEYHRNGDEDSFGDTVINAIEDCIDRLTELDEYDELIYHYDINRIFSEYSAECEEAFFECMDLSEFDSIQGVIDAAAQSLYEQWQRDYASDVAEQLKENFDL